LQLHLFRPDISERSEIVSRSESEHDCTMRMTCKHHRSTASSTVTPPPQPHGRPWAWRGIWRALVLCYTKYTLPALRNMRAGSPPPPRQRSRASHAMRPRASIGQACRMHARRRPRLSFQSKVRVLIDALTFFIFLCPRNSGSRSATPMASWACMSRLPIAALATVSRASTSTNSL